MMDLEGEIKMKGIRIQGLFERFDYEFSFKMDGVTIITGPNGFGKSTILKCLDALSNRDILFFLKLDFKEIEIVFEENTKNIFLLKDNNELSINGVKIENKILNASFTNELRHMPYMIKVDENRWMDRRSGEIYNTLEWILKNYNEENCEDFIFNEGRMNYPQKILQTFNKIRSDIGKIYFIKEQRLLTEKYKRNEKEIVNVIDELPQKFIDLINKVSNNYSARANELDSTYPTRLFATEIGITKNEYVSKMEEMNFKFDKLNKYNISPMKNLTNVLFKEEHSKALKIYFEDFNEKYKVYEDFINKLELFTDIVNNRLSFKKVVISRDKGIEIIDEDIKNRSLKLSELSSGEKQEIVLFYELIFETKDDVLLLIDEPEISLHIVWQKMFMDDLLKIVQYKQISVIVATHSPQIINNHWDRQIDLGALYGDKFNKNQFK